MITKISAVERHFTDIGWLKTYWLFSFSDYYDPANVQHGMLRVFNDDVVEAGEGFTKHPHEEMEIISIVMDGEMVHQDTMGNRAVIRAGDVQRMSAGTGLYHSEVNESDAPVHFFQIWIYPDKKGLAPSYDQKSFLPEQLHNTLLLLAAEKRGDNTVSLNSDGLIYRGRFETGHSVSYGIEDGRVLFAYVIDGEIEIDGTVFQKEDQVRVRMENAIHIKSLQDADILLVDVPDSN